MWSGPEHSFNPLSPSGGEGEGEGHTVTYPRFVARILPEAPTR